MFAVFFPWGENVGFCIPNIKIWEENYISEFYIYWIRLSMVWTITEIEEIFFIYSKRLLCIL